VIAAAVTTGTMSDQDVISPPQSEFEDEDDEEGDAPQLTDDEEQEPVQHKPSLSNPDHGQAAAAALVEALLTGGGGTPEEEDGENDAGSGSDDEGEISLPPPLIARSPSSHPLLNWLARLACVLASVWVVLPCTGRCSLAVCHFRSTDVIGARRNFWRGSLQYRAPVRQ
jgi:hypothetical protein